ncbi:MAG: hypothetical protein K2O73_08580, partial [Lachnospiraceae bacterium]|nr:hypothetical protein [Lachnospiraceae bacterium]
DYDAETLEWKAVLTVSKENFYNRKKIYISSVKAVDKGELYKNGIVSTSTYNNTVAYEDNALYWFAIEREELNTPKVESVTLKENGATVEPGDSIEVLVQVSAEDAELRDKDGCSVGLRCTKTPSNNNWHKSLYLDWDSEKNCYSGSMEITRTMYPGEWELYCADVYEVSNGEWSAWYHPSEDITFTIQNDGYDVEVPEVKSLQMSKRGEFVSADEAVQLAVEATDNEGIERVRVDLYAVEDRLTSKGREKSIYLERVGESNRYEGSFEIDEKTFSCEWYVGRIYIEDTIGNYQDIRSCQDGVYSTDSYYGAISKDSYSLEEHFYVNVGEEKNFVQPTVSVGVMDFVTDFSESGDLYGYQKTVELPRRTALSEMKKLLGTGAGHDGVTFEDWVVSHGSSDESEDPMILWKENGVYAKYDKTVVCLDLYDMTTYERLYQGAIFGKKGDTLPLPAELPGLRNIEWKQWIGDEEIIVNNVQVLSDTVQYVSGSAELDADNPATPPAPITPDTPVRPPYTEPVALPGQKIAEVVAEIAAAGNGATITVAMGDATVVPKDILEAAKGKDVDVVLQMDGYTWTINGKNILSENLKDINLRVIRNTEYIPRG